MLQCSVSSEHPRCSYAAGQKIKKEMTTYRFQITYPASPDYLEPDSVRLSADCLSCPCYKHS